MKRVTHEERVMKEAMTITTLVAVVIALFALIILIVKGESGNEESD